MNLLAEARTRWNPLQRGAWVLGHRGARKLAPENTMLAFEQALLGGADGVELDVRLSADGQPVVIHDATLTRVTRARWRHRVQALALEQLGQVQLGQGQTPPSLNEVVNWALKRRAKLNIELKSDNTSKRELADSVLQVLADSHLQSPVLLSSFDREMIRLLAEKRAGWDIAWLVDKRADLRCAPQLLSDLGISAINPRHALLGPAVIETLLAHGLTINTWTVNSEARALELARAGVHSIITDEPLKISAAIARKIRQLRPAT